MLNIEKEIELQRQRGLQGTLDDDIEEHRRHLEMIIELCREIQQSSGHDVRKVFARVGETMSEELEQIRKHEVRINRNQKEQVSTLNAITQRKKGLATELRSVIDRVKEMDYQSKDLSNALFTKEHQYEERMKDASGTNLVSKLKNAISSLKAELKEHSLNEGFMNSILFSSGVMRRGQHHLFDEMADHVQVSKTGTNNNTE